MHEPEYLKDFRQRDIIRGMAAEIRKVIGDRPVTFMEVCGGHTAAILRFGLPDLLPENVRLLSGPGCPVCVTPGSTIEQAVLCARRENTVVASYGDLIRVPGVNHSLESVRSEGANVEIIYGANDAVDMAASDPGRDVVVVGIGFETTAPTTAAALVRARELGLRNFLLLSAHKTMPAAMEWLVTAGEVAIDGLICPGHVSTITGSQMYEILARDLGKPCVISGFEPADLMETILFLCRQVAEGRSEVEIAYRRAVRPEGNRKAQAVMRRVYEPCASEWRGLGVIPGSGLCLRHEFAVHDPIERWGIELPSDMISREPKGCICGAILRGVSVPTDCALFGKACTPESPAGACMVSEEGTCHSWYLYGRSR
jgi:hydrogenase expression/formation protein HypD